MTTTPDAEVPQTPEELLTDLEQLAARTADDPFFVSDCEGELQVWREKALTHVRRDDTGTITMYSFPSSYRSTDEVIRIDLDTWDPGEDATDDQRRQDINDLVDSRAAVPELVTNARLLNARVAELEELVKQLADPDPCWFDHHGHCQVHGWPYTEPSCPDGRANKMFPPAKEASE